MKYNFDENVEEYFEFTLGGHVYQFRHMNTEELSELQKFEGDEAKANEYLYTFISSKEESAPEFKEVAKKMIVPQWKKFREMITAEYGA